MSNSHEQSNTSNMPEAWENARKEVIAYLSNDPYAQEAIKDLEQGNTFEAIQCLERHLSFLNGMIDDRTYEATQVSAEYADAVQPSQAQVELGAEMERVENWIKALRTI